MTIQSALDIYNLALSACNARGRLISLTDNKKERYDCDQWYDLTVRVVQEGGHWPCCKTTSVLEEVVERADNSVWAEGMPDTRYRYSYTLPFNCLRPRHLIDYSAFALSFDQVSGEVRLNTNLEKAVLVYSIYQDDVRTWTANQIQATAFGLAAMVAGPLTGRGELIQKNTNLANQFLTTAQSFAYDYSEEMVEHIPAPFVARGYAGPPSITQFIYPYGNLFGAAQA